MVKNFVAAWGNFRCWVGVCKRVEADDTGFVVALHRVATVRPTRAKNAVCAEEYLASTVPLCPSC